MSQVTSCSNERFVFQCLTCRTVSSEWNDHRRRRLPLDGRAQAWLCSVHSSYQLPSWPVAPPQLSAPERSTLSPVSFQLDTAFRKLLLASTLAGAAVSLHYNLGVLLVRCMSMSAIRPRRIADTSTVLLQILGAISSRGLNDPNDCKRLNVRATMRMSDTAHVHHTKHPPYHSSPFTQPPSLVSSHACGAFSPTTPSSSSHPAEALSAQPPPLD